MRHYLVIANQTLGGPELVRAIQERIDRSASHFHVLVPATHQENFYDRVLDAYAGPDVEEEDASMEAALRRLEQELTRLRSLGAEADGEVGPAEAVEAAKEVLERTSFDEVILSTLPAGLSRWVSMDLPSQLRRATETPVVVVTGPPAEE